MSDELAEIGWLWWRHDLGSVPRRLSGEMLTRKIPIVENNQRQSKKYSNDSSSANTVSINAIELMIFNFRIGYAKFMKKKAFVS